MIGIRFRPSLRRKESRSIAGEQSSWSTLAKVMTGAAGLLTAIVTFYTTFHKTDDHPKETTPTIVVQPAPSSTHPLPALLLPK